VTSNVSGVVTGGGGAAAAKGAEVTGAGCDASMPMAAGEVAVADGSEGWLVGEAVVELATAGAGVEAGAAGVVTVADVTFAVTFGAPAELDEDPVAVADAGAVVVTGPGAEAAI